MTKGTFFDDTELKKFAKALKDDIDYEDVLVKWSKDITSEITRTHGRRYSYTTPTTKRDTLRRRSGNVINAIRNSRRVMRLNNNEFVLLFDTKLMKRYADYIDNHLNTNVDGKEEYISLTSENPTERICIPLRRALDDSGNITIDPPYSPKLIETAKNAGTVIEDGDPKSIVWTADNAPDWTFMNVYAAVNDYNVDFSGENLSRLSNNTLIAVFEGEPYFILANTITFPKRLKLFNDIYRYFNKPSGYGSFRARMDKEVDKLLKKVTK